MRQCPKCQSAEIHRSRSKTKWEMWRRELTGRRPYRCHICGWRGWRIDLGPRFDELDREAAARALAPDPPNLEETDFERIQPPELSVDELDSIALSHRK